MFPFDLAVHQFFSNVDSPFFNGVFYFASTCFNFIPLVFIVLLSAFLISQKYGRRNGWLFLFISILSFILVWTLKLSLQIARPLDERMYAFGPSFPSGHTAAATAYFLSLLYFLRSVKNTWRRIIHILFCITCIIFVGVSRLYFGVHWLSDVIAGFIIGALSVYIIIRLFKRNS